MKFLDVGQHAEGFIAIGQFATGGIAIGQFATGAVAIGQIARGGLCIGMLAVGLWSIGMLSVGVVWSGGMLAAGGRARGLLSVQLVPRLGRRPRRSTLSSLSALHDGRRERGWVPATVKRVDAGTLHATFDGRAAALQLHPELAEAAGELAPEMRVLAEIQRDGPALIVERIQRLPSPPWQESSFWVRSGLQLAALVALAVLFWAVILDVAPIFARG